MSETNTRIGIEICIHCGYKAGEHHPVTKQCIHIPGGNGIKQEWAKTVFKAINTPA